MDIYEARLRRLFIYIPIVMLLARIIIPLFSSWVSNGWLTFFFFLYNGIFIYIYPILMMVILIHKRNLEDFETRLRVELYAGLASRILILNEMMLALILFIGGIEMHKMISEILGVWPLGIMSFILPNYFTGLGPTAYFEYVSLYLGFFYELLSGDKYFIYRNNSWINPLLIIGTYMFLTGIVLIGLLNRRLRKSVVIFFYILALLNSLFPFLLPILQVLLYGPVRSYHGFGIMIFWVYSFPQFLYLPYNFGRLAELMGYDKIMEVLKSR